MANISEGGRKDRIAGFIPPKGMEADGASKISWGHAIAISHLTRVEDTQAKRE